MFKVLFLAILCHFFTTGTLAASTEIEITAQDSRTNDQFGNSVKASGNYAIIGSPSGEGNSSSSGCAYIYDISNGQQIHKLIASDGADSDYFGKSVSIDGNYAVVGAYGNDNAGSESGSAYIFNITTGQQLWQLTPSNAAANDQFGYSVDIHGNKVIVGAFNKAGAGLLGSAYIFDVSTGMQLFELSITPTMFTANFGASVSISDNYAVVTAMHDYALGGIGAAYVFDPLTGLHTKSLMASDGYNGNNFGFSSDISNNYAIIGAYTHNDNGAAYIYDLSSGIEINKITAADGEAADYFGYSVAASGDYAVIGAYQDDDNESQSGSAYIYEMSTGEVVRKLTATNGTASDNFGFGVGITGDLAVIGAPSAEGNATESGAAYIINYTITPTPTTQAKDLIYTTESDSESSISWSRGDGDFCAVFMAISDSSIVLPSNSTSYNADSQYGLGSKIASSGWYCVYNGTGTSVTVSGLDVFTIYQTMVVEYNGEAGKEMYLAETNATNPVEYKNFVTWIGNDEYWDIDTNWSSEQVPLSSNNILIPATDNNPVINNSIDFPAQASNLKIDQGATLTINSGSPLKVNANLTNLGEIRLLASETANGRSGSLITMGNITNSGKMILNRNISGGTTSSSDYNWHSIGVPIEGVHASDYFGGDYLYNYSEADNSWENITSNLSIDKGHGYIVKTVEGDKNYAFTGTFNTGEISVDLENTGADVNHGYNLVCNPYPSQINLAALSVTNASMIYVWNPESNSYNYYQIGSGGSLSPVIESCQGFFIKLWEGYTTGNVTFRNSARISSSFGTSFKSAELPKPKISLKVTKGGYEDVLTINETPVPNNGYKLFSMNSDAPQIFVHKDAKDYCIYNMSEVTSNTTLPIGFQSETSGTYKFEATQQTFDEYDVTLIDTKTRTQTPLVTGTVIETEHSPSNNEQRFSLVFTKKLVTGIDSNTQNKVKATVINRCVTFITDKAFNYSVYTANGIKIVSRSASGYTETAALHPGLYIIKIEQNGIPSTQKISIQ